MRCVFNCFIYSNCLVILSIYSLPTASYDYFVTYLELERSTVTMTFYILHCPFEFRFVAIYVRTPLYP